MSFDPKDLRRALGKFATGVTVVTTIDENGDDVGMTANSFSSVSMDPPLILWSVDKGNMGTKAYREAEYFAVNVLNDSQVDISNRFAKRGEDKFSGLDFTRGVGGVPRITGSASIFECRTWNTYDGGDHLIIVGEVLNYTYQESVRSLVFHNGRYALSEMHPAMKSREDAVPLEGGVLKDYVLYLLRQALFTYSSSFYPKLSAFDITAEEWRVLTLLADRSKLSANEIGQLVSQPPQDLADTLAWLSEKQLLTTADEDLYCLTGAGRAKASELLDLAFEHERSMLSGLDDAEVTALQSGLKKLIKHKG